MAEREQALERDGRVLKDDSNLALDQVRVPPRDIPSASELEQTSFSYRKGRAGRTAQVEGKTALEPAKETERQPAPETAAGVSLFDELRSPPPPTIIDRLMRYIADLIARLDHQLFDRFTPNRRRRKYENYAKRRKAARNNF